MPTYTPADQSPINTVTKCNYFHNIVKEGDLDVCKPCGWPGNMCEKECIYGFEFDPIGDPAHGQGRFTVRPEFRTGGALVCSCFHLTACVVLHGLHLVCDQVFNSYVTLRWKHK